ncbi:nucleolar protein 3 [Gracilinanus agilis]|uniref:nucleolar protein 3 n=1 Tax=Gracilinanus agilis TaxID=191870 RepID=UPI001CFF3762|nr:nucleolar protein 3 [Gracilinanus agilis]
MGNLQERPSELIQRERRRLVDTLKQDSVILLDGLFSRGIITASEYESLDAMDDPERIVRKVLLIVQQKGEFACQELLKCASEIHPKDSRDPYWNWKLPQEGYGYHRRRSHESCWDNDRTTEISAGGTCIGVPNPGEEDKSDKIEGQEVLEVTEQDVPEDQESPKDPEPESEAPEQVELVEEDPEEPELDDFPGWNMEPEPELEPEPEYGEVVEDDDYDL